MYMYVYMRIRMFTPTKVPPALRRLTDGKMIANYRVQAELTAIAASEDGRTIVLGTVDGCLSSLTIADPTRNGIKEYLADLPSRNPQVSWEGSGDGEGRRKGGEVEGGQRREREERGRKGEKGRGKGVWGKKEGREGEGK